MDTFGDRLRELRKKKKLNQKDLGKLLGVAESTISMYERNGRQPDFDMQEKIANFFNVSIDYLVRGKESSLKEQAEEAYNDPDFQYAMRSLNGMNQETKEEVLNFIEYVLQREKGRKPGQRQPNLPRFNKE